MKLLRKITITSVRQRLLITRSRSASQAMPCPQCPNRPLMTPATDLAALGDYTLRTICRWVEADQIHYTESPKGLFVCLASIPDTNDQDL